MRLPIYRRIFGYYRVSVSERDVTRLQSLIYTERFVAYTAGKAAVFIPAKEKGRLLEAASQKRITVSVSGLLGFPRSLIARRHRIGIPIGILLSVFLILFGTSKVWRVEVTGNNHESADSIVENLRNVGFGVGSKTGETDYEEVIAAYRLAHPEIAWMGIYTEGTTAYVRVIETRIGEEEIGRDEKMPSHLTAACDGIILRVDTECGTPVVKAGDVIKKGDTLVLGWMKGAYNDRIFAAKGSVTARVSETFAVEIPYRQSAKTEVGRKKLEISLNFFEKRINFFKKTNKNDLDYVIIEKNRPFYLFGELMLPFGFFTKEAVIYTESEIILDAGSAALLADEELRAQMRQAVGDGDILFQRTWSEEKDGAYVLYATVEYTKNIAVSVPFAVN